MSEQRNKLKSQINIQSSFLNQVRKNEVNVKINLIGGHSTSGKINAFDQFVVLVKRDDDGMSLIYKSSIVGINIESKDSDKVEIFSK